MDSKIFDPSSHTDFSNLMNACFNSTERTKFSRIRHDVNIVKMQLSCTYNTTRAQSVKLCSHVLKEFQKYGVGDLFSLEYPVFKQQCIKYSRKLERKEGTIRSLHLLYENAVKEKREL